MAADAKRAAIKRVSVEGAVADISAFNDAQKNRVRIFKEFLSSFS